jgi:hypothetical protein
MNGQTSGGHWPNIGQTLGRHWVDIGQSHFEKHLNLGFYVAQNVNQNFYFSNPGKLLFYFLFGAKKMKN